MRGAQANTVTSSGHVSPLHRAAYCGHCSVIRLLLNYGALTSLRDADGKTALHKVQPLAYITVMFLLTSVQNTARILAAGFG